MNIENKERKEYFRHNFMIIAGDKRIKVKSADNGLTFDRELDPEWTRRYKECYILPSEYDKIVQVVPDIEVYYKVITTYIQEEYFLGDLKKKRKNISGYIVQSKTPIEKTFEVPECMLYRSSLDTGIRLNIRN